MPAPTDRSAFDALCAVMLKKPDVTVGRALSNDGLMVHGKLFAFPRGERIVVKLPPPRIDALAGKGAVTRVLMGQRLMKEWVEVHDPGDWRALADEARAYVASLVAG